MFSGGIERDHWDEMGKKGCMESHFCNILDQNRDKTIYGTKENSKTNLSFFGD